jgi:hypothetical protein
MAYLTKRVANILNSNENGATLNGYDYANTSMTITIQIKNIFDGAFIECQIEQRDRMYNYYHNALMCVIQFSVPQLCDLLNDKLCITDFIQSTFGGVNNIQLLANQYVDMVPLPSDLVNIIAEYSSLDTEPIKWINMFRYSDYKYSERLSGWLIKNKNTRHLRKLRKCAKRNGSKVIIDDTYMPRIISIKKYELTHHEPVRWPDTYYHYDSDDDTDE